MASASNHGQHRAYIVPAILSGVITAFSVAIDSFILHNVVVYAHDNATSSITDNIIGPLAYTFVGYWVAVLIAPLYNRLIGRRMDEKFIGIRWETVNVQKWALITGGIGTFATLFYFIGATLVDLSVVLPLTSAYIVYLVLYDTWQHNIKTKDIVMPTIITIIGAGATSVNRIEVLEISLAALFILLVLDQGSDAAGRITFQEGVRITNAVNFHFWRMLWSAVFSTVGIASIIIFTGRFQDILSALNQNLLELLLLVPIRMLLLFLSEILAGIAYKRGGLVSEVAVLSSVRVMLGVPITLSVSSIVPGAFGQISDDWRIWMIRLAGAALILARTGMLYRQRR